MSQKSSLPQVCQFVSRVLMPDKITRPTVRLNTTVMALQFRSCPKLSARVVLQ